MKEAEKLCQIAGGVDNGCEACVAAAVRALNQAFPDFEWIFADDFGLANSDERVTVRPKGAGNTFRGVPRGDRRHRMSWAYSGRDAGISLFDACLTAGAPMAFSQGMRVLEVGCRESDWLERAVAAWPHTHFVGMDYSTPRPKGNPLHVVQGDVMDEGLFAPESFDAVVSLSAIEHVGLGHYKDPKDPYGDSKALANIWHWLKPGGWLYFDVPYQPDRYEVLGTECRVYDDAAVTCRLLPGLPNIEEWRAYADSKRPGTLIDKPTTRHPRFYYVAMVWRKASLPGNEQVGGTPENR
jgi:SAM-dependent methyltransferase